MSLISVRNFVAPFTNTTHIVTIILFTVVFALFRMQGGSLSIENNGRDRTRSETAVDAPRAGISSGRTNNTSDDAESPSEILAPARRPAAPARAAPQPIPDEGTITLTPSEEDDLIGQMIGGRTAPAAKDKAPERHAPVENQRQKNGNSLDDIERSLGIR